MDDVERKLLDALRGRRGAPPELSDDLAALGLDSVEMAGELVRLEEQLGFAADEDVFDVRTVGELAGYIRARRARQR